MTEYWLQKKTIGGWSHVTWYDSLEQAMANFKSASDGDSGYCWRVVEAKPIAEKMLAEVVPVEAPNTKLEVARRNVWAGQASAPASQPVINSGWGGSSAAGWGNPASVKPSPAAGPPAHGLAGKVWMIHHAKKIKTRIDPNEVDKYLAEGYVKGGPKTSFVI